MAELAWLRLQWPSPHILRLTHRHTSSVATNSPGTRQLQSALPRGRSAAAALAAVRRRHRHTLSRISDIGGVARVISS